MRVLVLHGDSSSDEVNQLRLWLEAEGCELVIFVFDSSGGKSQEKALSELIAECDIVTLLLTSDLPLSEVQVAVLAAHSKGKKVIGVQLGQNISIEVLEKYGSASIPLKQNLIVGAVCEDHGDWIDDDGQPREEPETERHKCKKQRPAKKNAAA
jgi:NADPH:quinone reductase-like Zn-dependent oxidoreductase